MTLNELQAVLAELPEQIPVRRYDGLKDTCPRVVWNETGMEQTYSSNRADDLAVRVIVELIALPDNTESVWDVVRLFRLHRIPFSCACGFDEQLGVVSYEFSIRIIKVFPDE